MTTNTKKKYTAKCHQRNITFYLHEERLFLFSKTLNFQEFVKDKLYEEMAKEEGLANGEVGNI